MALRKKVGIAFGSGGVRGVAHIGVIKALLENDVPIDIVAGTSVGAWVAAHYAIFQDLPELENKTVGHAKDKALAMLEPAVGAGFIKGDKIQKLLSQWFAGKTFADKKIPLAIVTTDIISGQEIDFFNGDLVTLVRASMAIPTMFKPVTYKNYQLVDGGLVNPVPDDLVRKMGADVVIAVNLDNFQLAINNKPKINSLTGMSSRSLQIMRQHLAKYSLQKADVVIEPLCLKGGLLGLKSLFDDEQKNAMVKEGYKQAMAQMDKIKALIK
jgi:NTE family protein